MRFPTIVVLVAVLMDGPFSPAPKCDSAVPERAPVGAIATGDPVMLQGPPSPGPIRQGGRYLAGPRDGSPWPMDGQDKDEPGRPTLLGKGAAPRGVW